MRRVLVVDDEPHIRAVLRGYLEAGGLAVIEAGDGDVVAATATPAGTASAASAPPTTRSLFVITVITLSMSPTSLAGHHQRLPLR